MEKITAKWIDDQYVASPTGGTEEWYSVNGDEWFDEKGKPATSERFFNSQITLIGGPRNGDAVA